MSKFRRVGAAVLMTASLVRADVSFTQDVKFVGGTMVEMMRKMATMPLMGGRMKQAFEDQHYDVYVKGNKMARLGMATSTIYDLDAGTITTINNTKRTYVTTTFEEMKARMEQAQQRLNKGGNGDIEFDVKAENTGQTRTIDGQTAKEMLITMTAKQATSQGQMVVKADDWFVPAEAGSKELIAFQKKLSEKFAEATSVGMLGGIPGAAKGIAEAMKQATKQDGYPILMDMEMSGMAGANPMAAAMGGGNSDPNAPMLKMESQNSHLSTGSIDDSKFAIPAGYKEEKHK